VIKIILLDGMMQIYRCNFKLDELVTRKGQKTGLEYGFLKGLEAFRRYWNDEIIVCWEGHNNFRYKIDSEYKANRREKRKKDAHQFLTPERMKNFMGIVSMVAETAQDDELEADDVIASLAEKYCQTEKVIIYSGDKDLHQLLRDKPFPVVQVKEYQYRETPWTVKRISDKLHGLRPDQLAVYMAFTGDAIDNIPGAVRVRSPIIGAAIRNGYEPERLFDYELFTLKEIYALEEHIDSGRYAKNLELVTLKIKDVPIIERNWQPEEIAKWLYAMEFRTLKLCQQCGGALPGTISEEDEF